MLRLSVPALLLAALALTGCQSAGSTAAGAGGDEQVMYDGLTKQQHEADGLTEAQRFNRWHKEGRGP